jgi:pimeloyl-ACP methyl ester carboxylesterase
MAAAAAGVSADARPGLRGCVPSSARVGGDSYDFIPLSKSQEYFRRLQPPLLAVWGNGDPFFSPAGAEAFKRDIKDAKVTFLDTGHFALETHCDEIAVAIQD